MKKLTNLRLLLEKFSFLSDLFVEYYRCSQHLSEIFYPSFEQRRHVQNSADRPALLKKYASEGFCGKMTTFEFFVQFSSLLV